MRNTGHTTRAERREWSGGRERGVEGGSGEWREGVEGGREWGRGNGGVEGGRDIADAN